LTLFDFGLERRPPAEVAALTAKLSSWRVVDGQLRSKQQAEASAVGTPEPGGFVEGRVLHAGEPVAHAIVSLLREDGLTRFAESDTDGRFKLEAPAGRYTLSAHSVSLLAFGDGPSVEVKSGSTSVVADLRMDVPPEITGHVVDESGAPMVGVHVRFFLGSESFEAVGDRNGAFMVHGLRSAGTYVPDVKLAEFVYLAPATGIYFPPVQVDDLQHGVRDVRLVVKHPK
jgi:hypothetical protein